MCFNESDDTEMSHCIRIGFVYRLGLAARLQKLLARVHSSTHIWQHEANYSNVLRSSKRGILLEVHSVWTEYSHLLVHCTPSSGK
jgi:hypothetical protein